MSLPTSAVLNSAIASIIIGYKKVERLDTIKLLTYLQKLPSDNKANDEIKLGALMWIEKDIKYREYKGKNPVGFFTGSVLYKLVNENLAPIISKITKHEKLIYLVKFYKFMDSENCKDMGLIDLTKLRNTIPGSLQIEVNEQEASINKLLKRMPAPRHFLTAFKTIYSDYHKYYKELGLMHRFMHEPDRDQMVEFLNLLDIRLQADDTKSGLAVKRDGSSYLTRYGAALYILHEIDKTYQFLWGSDRSHLYTLCCKATNLKHPAEISPDDTLSCFSNLFNFISNELKSKTFAEEWQGLRDAESFLRAVNLRLFMRMCVIMQSGSVGTTNPTYSDRIKKTLAYATKIAASYAAGITIGALFTQLTKKTISMTTVYFAGPAAGNIIYLLSCAGDYLASSYLPNKVTEQVGEKVSSAVMTATLTELNTVSADSKNTLRYPTPSRHEDISQEDLWIQALFALPPSVMPDYKKRIILELFDPVDYEVKITPKCPVVISDVKSDNTTNQNTYFYPFKNSPDDEGNQRAEGEPEVIKAVDSTPMKKMA